MRNNYTDEFKQSVVRKALMPGSRLRKEICEEAGIHPAMISKWIKMYGTTEDMKKNKKSKSPHNWSPAEKLKALKETENLNEKELGEYLRSHGLHSHNLEEWNSEILTALKSKFYPHKKAPEVLALEKENRDLKKNLNRKEKALAEVAALLVLKKKAESYFPDEE